MQLMRNSGLLGTQYITHIKGSMTIFLLRHTCNGGALEIRFCVDLTYVLPKTVTRHVVALTLYPQIVCLSIPSTLTVNEPEVAIL